MAMPHLIMTARQMVRAAEIFGIPLVVTEQYPKAFGRTITELTSLIEARPDGGAVPHPLPTAAGLCRVVEF